MIQQYFVYQKKPQHTVMEEYKIQTLNNVIFMKSSIQSKITWYLKMEENITHNQGQKTGQSKQA